MKESITNHDKINNMPLAQKQPFFSIVIPTLNEEKFLPFLLQDLKKQNLKDFEILVVDGGSTDQTPVIIKKFSGVKVIISPIANVSYQRNLGGRAAKGRYLLFVDADTRLPAYFLVQLKRRVLTANPDFFTTCLDCKGKNPADEIIVRFFNFILTTGKILRFPVAMGAFMGCKKLVFEQSGGFNPKIKFAEDTEFVKRLAKNHYHLGLYKNPRYFLSLRRFRHEGTLKLLRQYTKLNLKWLVNGFTHKDKMDYPMRGGSYYQRKKTSSKFIKALDKILREIKNHP